MNDNNIQFNSHYVPLSPPYPILYFRGRVGIQTGTLLVVQPQIRGGNAPGALRMVSMPVVNYVNKPKQLPQQLAMSEHWAENKVWQTDISGTEILGYDNADTIHLETFSGIERLRNMSGMSSGFSLSRLVQDVKSLGFKIAPEFYPQNPHGSLELMYGHLDANTACLTANHIMNVGGGLMIAVKAGTLEETFKTISEQVDDYISAVQRDDITVDFRCKETQFAELINLLNQKYAVHQ